MNVSPRAARILMSVIIGASIVVVAPLALAEPTTYWGVTFPDGDISFADRAVAYCAASCVRGAMGDPSAALGPPDCGRSGGKRLYGCDTCAVSLGFRVSHLDDRGYLIVEFVDNRLSDVPGNDLFIYITDDKPGLVEISSDGIHFVHVGEVRDYPGAIDIAPFVSGAEEFRFVRISDVPADEDGSPCPGPSIDAVGAMGPVIHVEPSEAFGMLEVLPLGELAILAGRERPVENLLLILDTSASMNEGFEGASKIVVAKQILKELVDDIAAGTNVGLRTFAGCERSTVVTPIGPLNRAAMKAQIQGIGFGGLTPLAYVLGKAREDFAATSGSKMLILVSDGMETCEGDPIAAARALVAAGYDLQVHIVGYDVARYQEAREQLQEIAEVAGGDYVDASDSQQLRQALQVAAAIQYQVYNEQGEVVFVGLLGAPGPRLPAGVYGVIIETAPPLELTGVSVQPAQTTTITLRRADGNYVTEVTQP